MSESDNSVRRWARSTSKGKPMDRFFLPDLGRPDSTDEDNWDRSKASKGRKTHRQDRMRQSRTGGDGPPPRGLWESAETTPDKRPLSAEEFKALAASLVGTRRAELAAEPPTEPDAFRLVKGGHDTGCVRCGQPRPRKDNGFCDACRPLFQGKRGRP